MIERYVQDILFKYLKQNSLIQKRRNDEVLKNFSLIISDTSQAVRASPRHSAHPVRLPPGGEERQRQEPRETESQGSEIRRKIRLLYEEGQ